MRRPAPLPRVRLALLLALLSLVGGLTGACGLLPKGGGYEVFRDGDTAPLVALLRSQEEAWNAGDIEGFMARGYWNSPELTFLSGGNRNQGYEVVLEGYRERYTRGDREMGHLTFSGLAPRFLTRDLGLVHGAWKLEFTNGTTIEGLFTLLLRRFDGEWRIVHDHTSLKS